MALLLLVIFVAIARIHADCVIEEIDYSTKTGEDLWRALLLDLGSAEIDVAKFSRQDAAGCTANQGDINLQIIQSVNADNYWLEKLSNGSISPSGAECVTVNSHINWFFGRIPFLAKAPITGVPNCNGLTGAAAYQYLMQRFSRATRNLLKYAPMASTGSGSGSYGGGAGGSTPGKWQKVFIDTVNHITAMQKIVQDNDEAGCVAATKLLAAALKAYFETLGVTSITLL